MRVTITIDERGEDVSVHSSRDERSREDERSRANAEENLASLSGDRLSAGQAAPDATGFNPEDLPTITVDPQAADGVPGASTVDTPMAEASGTGGPIAASGPMAAPVDNRAPPLRGRTYPLMQPREAAPDRTDVFLGNEF